MDREFEPISLSEDEFLAWAEGRDGRDELVEGTVVMQAGATRDHERVAKRIFALLYAQVDESRFDVNKGDFGIRIWPGPAKTTLSSAASSTRTWWSIRRAKLARSARR